jgi:hypothetical protein
MKYWMIIGQFLLGFAVQADSLSLLSAEGFGFADAKRFPESQARLMAVRAAKIDAQRNLLETINGVRVTAGTTVKDMALESDIIGTRVKGMLQGSFEVSSDVKLESDNWVASVTMAVCLAKDDGDCRERTTLASITQPNLKGAPAADRFSQADVAAVATAASPVAAPVASAEETPGASVEASVSEQPSQAAAVVASGNAQHSGLIVDASSLNFSPMLDVRLKTGQGKELYGPGHVAMGTDWLHWAASLESAQAMSDIVGDNTLVVTPSGLGEASELVIEDQDAIAIFTSNTMSGDYLSDGKVIIVVSGS